jgi:hypothetical protein
MKRRNYLKTLLAGAVLGVPSGAAGAPAKEQKSILLHVDLSVDPARETEMLDNFHKIFRPTAQKHPGYIDVKMLKLRSALKGSAPEGVNYRFALAYQSEELRLKWVASDAHQKVWPTIEKTLKSKDYSVLLFDVV